VQAAKGAPLSEQLNDAAGSSLPKLKPRLDDDIVPSEPFQITVSGG
jgi:hypothetical protein